MGCPPGGLALDVFMGTGTLLRVAKDMGIRAVGIETNEAYCELAANRMREPRMEMMRAVPVPEQEQAELW